MRCLRFALRYRLQRRGASSIGEERNLQSLVTPEEDASRHRGRSEPIVQAIEGRVDRLRRWAVERERQLDCVVTERVVKRDAESA